GFYKTTMDEIAKHIHKAKGILYYYFKSKEELFNQVLKQELNNVKLELTKIVNYKADSMTLLEKYTLARYKLLNTAYNYHETLKADFFEKYHFVKDVRDDFAEFERNQISLILQKGIKEGYVNIKMKDLNSYLDIIFMIMNSIEIPFFLQNKYTEYQPHIEEIAILLFKGLKPHKPVK
ncbi:MAG: helix-turn-helix transcriptional regulator, partial [Bacteroidia bacterium]|nr:helix-turn-helix transcriptional regulator [Bacteroidia bacterium]